MGPCSQILSEMLSPWSLLFLENNSHVTKAEYYWKAQKLYTDYIFLLLWLVNMIMPRNISSCWNFIMWVAKQFLACFWANTFPNNSLAWFRVNTGCGPFTRQLAVSYLILEDDLIKWMKAVLPRQVSLKAAAWHTLCTKVMILKCSLLVKLCCLQRPHIAREVFGLILLRLILIQWKRRKIDDHCIFGCFK